MLICSMPFCVVRVDLIVFSVASSACAVPALTPAARRQGAAWRTSMRGGEDALLQCAWYFKLQYLINDSDKVFRRPLRCSARGFECDHDPVPGCAEPGVQQLHRHMVYFVSPCCAGDDPGRWWQV